MPPIVPALLLALGALSCARRGPTAPSAHDATPAPLPSGSQATVTFRVQAPTGTPAGDTVFVAGTFQAWNPANPSYALTKQPDGRWTIALDLTPGAPIQFKFTRGSWARVEKDANGNEIGNRTLTPVAGGTYDFTVQRWADLAPSTITGNVTTFTWAPFLNGRRVWVYLPPGYDAGTQRYPVLYMHDGQNPFDARTSFAGEWRVDETCEQLIGSGQVAPLIVVGVDNSAARCDEYTPWPDPTYGGGQADAYLDAIVNVLVPEIDRRYRTLAGPNHRFMAGSSLGGLVSAYAGWTRADVFGRVAAFSPSYGWDNRHFAAWAAGRSRGPLQRLYQDMGTAEGNSPAASAQYVTDLRTIRDLAIAQGFQLGVDLQSVEGAGQAHNEAAWAARFPGALVFLAGPANVASVP